MRLIARLAIALVLAGVGYVGVTGWLLAKAAANLLMVGTVTAALDRQDRPTDPLALGYRGTPLQALSLPFETVALPTPLGPAEAWLIRAPDPEVGRAVYVHGIAGAREDGYRHMSMLHKAGWTVLLISYRNDPDAPPSPDGHYGLGLTEWQDLQAAIAFISAKPDSARVLVVAESMGGAILGQFLTHSPLADRVLAVALDSPAISFASVLRHLAGQSGKPLPGAMAWAAGVFVRQLTGLPLERAETAAGYVTFSGPLFVAHGAGDRIVPIGPSQGMARARTDETTVFWTGADHLGSFAEDPQGYRSAFAAFLAALNP